MQLARNHNTAAGTNRGSTICNLGAALTCLGRAGLVGGTGLAHADDATLYVDGGLRSSAAAGTLAAGGVGIETELGRSGIFAGAQANRSIGNKAATLITGTISYEGRNWLPFAKAGSSGDGSYEAVGAEYRTLPTGQVASAGRVLSVYARFRFE